jgi:T5SS/PEP-CTERM-associated repeat protein
MFPQRLVVWAPFNQIFVNRIAASLMAITLVCTFSSRHCIGQTEFHWQPGSVLWYKSSSWVPGSGPPGEFDIAMFDSGTTGTDIVKWDVETGNQLVGELHFTKGQYIFDNLDFTEYELTIGSSNPNAFSVTNSDVFFSLNGLNLNVAKSNAYIGAGATFEINTGNGGLAGSLNVDSAFITDGTVAIRNGTISSESGVLGVDSGDLGNVSVVGANSSWHIADSLIVGDAGRGALAISAGAQVSTKFAIVGSTNQAAYSRIVLQTDSRLDISEKITVGANGLGVLDVVGGSEVTAGTGVIGQFENAIGDLNVENENSHLQFINGFKLGVQGQAAADIRSGGKISATEAVLAEQSGSEGFILVDGTNSKLELTNDLYIGKEGLGNAQIFGGGQINNHNGFLASEGGSTGTALVHGGFSKWTNTGDLSIGGTQTASGGSAHLSITNGAQVNVAGTTRMWSDSSIVIVNGGLLNTHSFDNSAGGSFHLNDGRLTVSGEGGYFDPGDLTYAVDSASANQSATLVITNHATTELTNLYVGANHRGFMQITDGGTAKSFRGYVGQFSGSQGEAIVDGAGSLWDVTRLEVGRSGNGTLFVQNGGKVTSTETYIGLNASSNGFVSVGSNNAHLEVANKLYVGVNGISAQLQISSGGLVTVGDTFEIGENGVIDLVGGRFEFGDINQEKFQRINKVSGSLAGNLFNTGFTDLATLAPFKKLSNVDMTDVMLVNSGTYYGSQIEVGTSLVNSSTGELYTTASDLVQFEGSLFNSGEVNNLGGTIRFEESIINQSGGFIGGRGSFAGNAGWTNKGTIAFSGNADLFGDIQMDPGSSLVTSGGSTTTFYDDVIHNGSEIRTSAGSNSVFFGAVTGAGNFTGTGNVFLEGDLRPGNSPGAMLFEGSVFLGTNSNTEIELGGVDFGQFDQLFVEGDLSLDGTLNVFLSSQYQLGFNREFLIANVGGELTGQFDGFDEGDIVGTFDGFDLFISYTAGDGNDIGLFTAIPEPASTSVIAILFAVTILRRRRATV